MNSNYRLSIIIFITSLQLFSFQAKKSLAQTAKSFASNTNWSWQNPIPQGNALYDVFVFNRDSAIAVAGAGAIVKTIDGGINWQCVHLSDRYCPNLYSVHFIDSNTGWAVGDSGAIYKTIDGGNNWSRQNSGTMEMVSFSIRKMVAIPGAIKLIIRGVPAIVFSSSIRSMAGLWAAAG